jgi:DNA-binding transcriptional ArsR family regulator
MTTSAPSDQRLHAASELLRALASPIRLGIVCQLADKGQRVYELVDALGVSQPLVSQHLRILRASRIVTARRHAHGIEYSLTDEHLAAIALDAVRYATPT